MSETPDPDPRTPRAEYEARLAARRSAATAAGRREARLANARLIVFLGGGLLVWFVRGTAPLPLLLSVPIAAFVGCVVAHGRARRGRRRAERAAGFYETRLDRLDLRLADGAPTGSRFADEAHPYAVHLDLFGNGSLYQLLCNARTSSGRETLAAWLLSPAAPDRVRDRQAAVRELSGRLDLREELATLDLEVLAALESAEVTGWADGEPALASGPARSSALALAASMALALLLTPWLGAVPVAVVALLELGLWRYLRTDVRRSIAEAERPGRELRLARELIRRVECEGFESPRLRELHAAFETDDGLASERLDALLWRLDALDWRQNEMFAPLAAFLLWGTNWAFAVERWRHRWGTAIPAWIEALGELGELEALLDLAAYAYEHPADPFPTVEREGPGFEGDGLRHPLLPREACVPNDVRLSDELRLLVVTGSNMSGKSTLLRTVGVNAVLAQAGAPVPARSLRMSRLSIGASLRAVDSLRDGASRFYAEVRAIRRAVRIAERQPPALFLLDELLHGTNSHDRRIGAEAIVRELLDRGAIGLVTTHDLALAAIADELGARAANVHFEFRLVQGEIEFDYRLRPGVVRTGNALEIMRAVGLDV